MSALKPDLRAALRASFGGDLEAFEHALAQPAPVSVRLNPFKPSEVHGEQVPWCMHGRYLAERPVFTLDPRLHAGAYYVQEASSMILEPVFNATGLAGRDITALDVCAAPGGKSTHLRSLLSDGSLLVCNEIDPKRASILCENIWKWGHPNVVVCNNAPERFSQLQRFFDLIVVDAPCSGEGLMRKDPYAVSQWSSGLVRECAVRQRRILDAVWPSLRPGGYLVYGTCTYEACENEEQVERLMTDRGAEHIEVVGTDEHGIGRGRNGIGLRCAPHLVKGEGQFMALLRKPGVLEHPHAHPRVVPPMKIDDALRRMLEGAADLDFHQRRDLVHASHSAHADAIQGLIQAVDPIVPGIPIAELNGQLGKPHPALALSTLLDRNSVPTIAVDKDDALRYLRGEALRATQASGFALVVFEELALGWAKGAGKRWNNHWPDPWRIRMR